MAFARLSAVRPNPERRRIPPAGASAPASTLDHPLDADGLLHVQQTAGNVAAVELVQRQAFGGAMGYQGPTSGQETGPAPAPASEPGGTERRTLRQGMTGEDVKVLQMKLGYVRERENDRDEQGDARIDGIFGPLTYQDVVEFQRDTGLDPDGVVGPRTWNGLDSLVPGRTDETQEIALNEQFSAALELRDRAQYDAAIELFETILVEGQPTPETQAPVLANIGVCHHQRGRFGIAVTMYERALGGRFNMEGPRASLLEDLGRARRNEFRPDPRPDPEPIPIGADPTIVDRYSGGGVTEREPVKSGDTGRAVDLYKGKLWHMMLGWGPNLSNGDAFDATVTEITRKFQAACGLAQTGEGDAATWHALDSFSHADVEMSVITPHRERQNQASAVAERDPAAAIPMWEALIADMGAMDLDEAVKSAEAHLARCYHKLGRFEEALIHYEPYLSRRIPCPEGYGVVLEGIYRARDRRQ